MTFNLQPTIKVMIDVVKAWDLPIGPTYVKTPETMWDFIRPPTWSTLRDQLPSVRFLYEPLIPAYGVTLVHGPPECGKSAWTWGVANAISTGAPYLGIPTSKAEVLLLSNDMNVHEFKLRWGTTFDPQFSFLCTPKFNCATPKFNNNSLFKAVKDYVNTHNVKLVLIDAVGGVHAGLSAKDDQTATLVHTALTNWLSPAAILLIAHDRKAQVGNDGKVREPTHEDFLGSQMWRANATSQIHMWKATRHMSMLQHDKSQVAIKLEDKIKLYIDLHGMAELWDEHRASEVASKFQQAVKELGLRAATTTVQVEGVAKHCDVSLRTAWRWKSLGEG